MVAMPGPVFAAAVLAVALMGAVTDIGWRRVPNWLTVTAAIAGVAAHGLLPGGCGWWWGLAGAAAGVGMLLAPAVAGWVGAGDMKLLGALGATGGWPVAVGAALAGTLAGAVAAVVVVAWHWRRQFAARALQAAYLAGAVPLRQALRQLGEPLQRDLPYGACLALGAVITLAGGWMGWW